MGNTNSKRNRQKKVTFPLEVLRDALKCADRFTLEKCRLVCHKWNNFIRLNPNALNQRYQFKELIIGYPLSFPPSIKENTARMWTDLPAFKNCCKELKDTPLLVSDGSEDEDLYVFLHFYDPPPSMATSIKLNLINQNLPHFLKHISDDCVIGKVHLEERIQMPSLPLPLPLPFTIQCRRIPIPGALTRSSLRQLTIITTTLFSPKEISCRVKSVDGLHRDIERIAHYSNQMQVTTFGVVPKLWCFEREEFNGALRYFHTHDVPSIISRVEISTPLTGEDEVYILSVKATSSHINEDYLHKLSMEAMALPFISTSISLEEHKFVYKCTNTQSEKKYRLVVEINENESRKDAVIIFGV